MAVGSQKEGHVVRWADPSSCWQMGAGWCDGVGVGVVWSLSNVKGLWDLGSVDAGMLCNGGVV